jgi:hypothetical protein
VLAQALQPNPAGQAGVWIIDGTLIRVHDQSITAIRKNYRRSVNTQHHHLRAPTQRRGSRALLAR